MMRYWLCVVATLLTLPSLAVAATEVKEVAPSVWLVEDHSLPIVTVRVLFEQSGSAYDPTGKEGVANLATHLLDEGAGTLDSLAFQHALESKALRFSASISDDVVVAGMQTISEHTNAALDLLTLALQSPRFDEDAVTRIRSQIISELKQAQENPNYLASRAWKENAFAGHPYQHPKQGTLESVNKLTRSDIQLFAHDHLACGVFRIVVVGDISAQKLMGWAQKAFPRKDCAKVAPPAAVADVTAAVKPSPVVVAKNLPQTVIRASLPALQPTDPRYAALTVLNDIFGGSTLTSRLGKNIRDKNGLAYYAESDIELRDHAAVLSIQLATRTSETQKAIALLLGEINAIRTHGVSKEELEDAKNYLMGSYPLKIDQQEALAAYLSSIQHAGFDTNYINGYEDRIRAVTLDDVNSLAKTLFASDPMIVLVGNVKGSSKP